MIDRAREMMENEDFSSLEAMAEVLLQSANMKQASVQDAKDLIADYEENFEVSKLTAAIDILVDVYAA
jgi:hypothetical protein